MTLRKPLARIGVWLLRLLCGVLVVSALAVLAARSDAAGRYAAARIERALAEATGRPARVERASLSVFPPGIAIAGTAIARGDGSFEAPLIHVESAAAWLSLTDLLRGELVVDVVEAEGVAVRRDAEEPRPEPRRARRRGRLRFTLRRVNLRDGALFYRGHRAPFTLEASDLIASAASESCPERICLEGHARTGRFEVAYAEHRLVGDAMSLRFDLRGERLHVSRFSVKGAGFRSSGTAIWTYTPPGAARLDARLSAGGSAVEAVRGSFPIRAARLDARAAVTVEQGRVAIDGSVELEDLVYPGIGTARSAEGAVSLKEGTLQVEASASGVVPTLAGLEVARAGAAKARVTVTPEREASVDLEAGPVLLRDLLARIDPRLPRADVLARTEGRIAWRTGEPDTLAGDLALTLTPFRPGEGEGTGAETPDEPGARPRTEIEGTATLLLGRDEVRLVGGRLFAPGLEAGVEGTIQPSSRSADLDVRLESVAIARALAQIRELPAVATAIQGGLDGQASGPVRLALRPAGNLASGRLDGRGLTIRVRDGLVGPFDATAHWRWAGADLEISSLALQGVGWSGSGSLLVDTAAAWPLSRADLAIRDLPAAPLWQALGISWLESGALTGTAFFEAGEEGATLPRHETRLALTGSRLAGIAVPAVRLEGSGADGTFTIRSLEAETAAGLVEGSGVVDPVRGTGTLDLRGQSLDLGVLAEAAREGSETSGLLALSGEARLQGGTLSFEGPIAGRDVVLAGLPVGELEGSLAYGVTAPGLLVAGLNAPALGVQARFQLADNGRSPLEVDLRFEGLALEKLLPLLPEGGLAGLRGTGTGSVSGRVPLDRPLEADLTARVDDLVLAAGGVDLRLMQPAAITLGDGRARIDRSRFAGPGSELVLSGSYDLREKMAGEADLAGRFDAKLLALAVPDLLAEGSVEVDLRAETSGDRAVYGGLMRTAGMRLEYPGLPTDIEDLRMTARISPDGSVGIEEIGFRALGGEITGDGTGRLKNLRLDRAEIRLHGSSMSLRPYPDLQILFDGDATLVHEAPAGRIKARLDVIRALYNLDLAKGMPGGGRGGGPAVGAAATKPSMALDLEVVAPAEVLIRNEDARLEGSARLHIGGTLARPEMTGRITILEGGWLRFRDVTYTSEEGGIDFDDPGGSDAALSLSGTTQVREYEITLHILGRLTRPRIELSSQPALSQTDIVSLLTTGRTFEEGTAVSLVADKQVTQYLAAPISEALERTVGKALGLTNVQIDPHFAPGGSDPTARLTLSKRVSPELLFTYSANLSNSSEVIYRFEYMLSRAWQMTGLRDFDGSASADLNWRHRWGGPPRAAAREATASPADGWLRGEIARIDVTGSPLEDERSLLKKARIKPGRTYARADALEAREQIREYTARHGYPLARVQMRPVLREPAGADGEPAKIALTYEIDPGPGVDLRVRGLGRTRALVKAVHEAWGRALEPDDLVPEGTRALSAHLGSKGYAAARISPDVRTGERRMRITYDVDRGPVVKVRRIAFEGVSSLPEEDLREAIATREDRWNTSGRLRPPLLPEDANTIAALYLDRGYLDATVSDPVVTISEDRRRADVTFTVREGEIWRLGEVAIEGASGYSVEGLREATLLREGAVLRPRDLEAAEERLLDLLDANGFNGARIERRVEGPPSRSRVIFTVQEGPRQRLDRVVVSGNEATAGRVIRREVTLEPGDPISRSGMLNSQRNLYATGIFRSVDLRAEPLEEDPNRATLAVEVAEGSPIVTIFGAGYDTEEQVQGFAQVGHNNIFGTGRSGSILLRGSALNEKAQLTVRDRQLFGIPFEGLLTAYWDRWERESFVERKTGGGLQLSREITKQVTILGRYNIEDVNVSDIDLTTLEDPGPAQDTRLVSVGAALAVDSRDDILSPTRGSFTTADTAVYGAFLGSLEQFTRLYGSHARFLPVGRSTVVALSARLGLLRPFASTDRVPLSERFFSGGDTTLRGFATDQAGPLDPKSLAPTGGELQVILNGELRFPIYKALRGVVFYDVGNTFFKPGAIRWSGTGVVDVQVVDPNYPGGFAPVAIQDGFRHVLGAGLRVDTPLGPIRLEYGRKMDRRFGTSVLHYAGGGTLPVTRREPPYEIFLSIGQAF